MGKRMNYQNAEGRQIPEQLRKGLAKFKKAELIDILVRLADEDRRLLVLLKSRYRLDDGVNDLVATTREAIAKATAFDMRDCNHNFSYDYEAYFAVGRNLIRLIEMGDLRVVLDLSLELMERGSYQVEMSDEGMMTEDIKDCLLPVLNAVEHCDLAPRDMANWCGKMIKADRVGCIWEQKLKQLQDHFKGLSTAKKPASPPKSR